MNLPKDVEHFVTLFDSNFLPMGIALHDSLMAHAQPFHLWIICIDDLVKQQLDDIALTNVTLIPLDAAETPELLAVKPGRSRSEYCWTLTPFSPQIVFDMNPEVRRVTYLDADLFFFDQPKILLEAFERSGKQVSLSEHAYDPRYDQTDIHGRFCVQFMTFVNSAQTRRILRWWQERCIEWCFARLEDGKFGDQKYLDVWPEMFKNDIYILESVSKTLAPWNVNYFTDRQGGNIDPVFYHFHGLRLITPRRLRLYLGYKIGSPGKRLYDSYLAALRRSIEVMRRHGIGVPCIPERPGFLDRLRFVKRKLTRTTRTVSI